MPVQIQLRHDTGANWTSADPTLVLGEIGIETDASPPAFKVGDGATAWSGLPYSPATGGSISVTDGSTTVNPATSVNFTAGATVTDGGGGVAQVAITPGGISDITDLPTAETDTTKRLGPDGAGGVQWDAGGGGGGITQSYIGKNAVGGTVDALNTSRIYILKQMVLASDGLVPSVEIYCSGNGGNPTYGWNAVVATDSAGAPGILLALASGGSGDTNGVFMDSTWRWYGVPLGLWLPAGTYWIGLMNNSTQYNAPNLAYDAPGGTSDVYSTIPSYTGESGGWPTTTGRDYSIRCPFLT